LAGASIIVAGSRVPRVVGAAAAPSLTAPPHEPRGCRCHYLDALGHREQGITRDEPLVSSLIVPRKPHPRPLRDRSPLQTKSENMLANLTELRCTATEVG